MLIVGFSGKSKTGKDYMARHLSVLGWRHIAFADQLKMQCIAEGLCTYEEAFHTKPPEKRHLLQQRGSDEGWMKYGKDMWVRAALDGWCKLYEERYGWSQFVLSDVRFPHEVEGIEAHGGIVIRIEAPKRAARNGLSDEKRNHISETALDDWNFEHVVYNDPEYEASSTQLVDRIVLDYLWNGSTSNAARIRNAIERAYEGDR